LYPEEWGKCVSCEIVSHCAYALDYLRNLKLNGLRRGCYFSEQLKGEESIYQTLNFVNGQQTLAKTIGEKKYLSHLRKANMESPCLQTPK
jgi:hypothetical protein